MAAPESPQSREFRQMRHDVDDVYELLTVVQQTADSTHEAVGAIKHAVWRHDTRFEEVQRTLDRQAVRADRTEDNQRRQAERLGRMETRLGGIEESQQEQGERLTGVEGRLEGVDNRLERMEHTQQEILTLLRGRSG